jgi:hypothetical protein
MRNELLTIVAFVLCIPILPNLAIAQADKRDLSAYQNGGVYDRKLDFLSKSTKILEDAQLFIWSAWANKRKSYFKFYEYNREGDRLNMTFFIEPVSGGGWHVVEVRITDQCYQGKATQRRLCNYRPVETVYNSVNWEKLKFPGLQEPIETNVDILVLKNLETGDRFEFRKGALF